MRAFWQLFVTWFWAFNLLLALPAAQAAEEAVSNVTAKDLLCPKVNLFGPKLMTDVCWSCFFPMYIAGVRTYGKSWKRPDGANDNAFCACDSNGLFKIYGTTIGFWAPSRLIEVVRKPWCFPALIGAEIGDGNTLSGSLGLGGDKTRTEGKANHFYNVHYYAFPLLEMLELTKQVSCSPDGFRSMDLISFSEAFPNWTDEELSALINPEALLFGNPVALAGQIADCTASSTPRLEPMDSMFWAAGCWGMIYPLSGKTVQNDGGPEVWSLTATKYLYLLSRIGLVRRKMGSDALCEGKIMPVMVKSQYRMQQLWPISEASASVTPKGDSGASDGGKSGGGTGTGTTSGGGAGTTDNVDMRTYQGSCCHRIGETAFTWGTWRQVPGKGEDAVYLLWQWVDCCVGVIGGE